MSIWLKPISRALAGGADRRARAQSESMTCINPSENIFWLLPLLANVEFASRLD
uniref:Uncharacterized protein n=1 Tax=Rhizophora mucronata TaxID=61149 RepID=A0A2P2P5U6_RHIMU